MGKKNLMTQIKEMEDAARKSVACTVEEKKEGTPSKVEFDTWFYLRSEHIPGHHMKEVVLADFKARKLTKLETPETFDKALESYGIKLKK